MLKLYEILQVILEIIYIILYRIILTINVSMARQLYSGIAKIDNIRSEYTASGCAILDKVTRAE